MSCATIQFSLIFNSENDVEILGEEFSKLTDIWNKEYEGGFARLSKTEYSFSGIDSPWDAVNVAKRVGKLIDDTIDYNSAFDDRPAQILVKKLEGVTFKVTGVQQNESSFDAYHFIICYDEGVLTAKRTDWYLKFPPADTSYEEFVNVIRFCFSWVGVDSEAISLAEKDFRSDVTYYVVSPSKIYTEKTLPMDVVKLEDLAFSNFDI